MVYSEEEISEMKDKHWARIESLTNEVERLKKSLIETQKREHKKELFIDELLSKHARRSSTLAEIRSAITKFDELLTPQKRPQQTNPNVFDSVIGALEGISSVKDVSKAIEEVKKLKAEGE